jgi:hypothetical protein
MENDVTSRSFRISFIEMVIVIGVFALISILVFRLFLAADSLQKDAVNTSEALIKAETIAEVLKGSNSFEDELLELGLSKETISIEQESLTFQMYFNQEWEPVQTIGEHVLQVTISTQATNAGNMEIAEIIVFEEMDLHHEIDIINEWCNLTVKKYHPND